MSVDLHGGLRVWLEYEGRTIFAKWSAEAGVDPRNNVEGARLALQQRLGYLDAWLIAYRRQHGEVMERPENAMKAGD